MATSFNSTALEQVLGKDYDNILSGSGGSGGGGDKNGLMWM